MATTHSGKCFCGAVELQVTGDPDFLVIVIEAYAEAGVQAQSTPSRCAAARNVRITERV